MRVAVQLEFKADRKEPLGQLLRRVAALFAANGLEPEIDASFSDPPSGLRSTSAVERALRKYPHLAALERHDAPLAGANLPAVRRLTSVESAGPFPLADVLALADGVPRSLPFHAVHVGFGHPGFGRVVFPLGLAPPAGIAIADGWWVNGRVRSVTALYSVESASHSKTLPDPPAAIAAVLAGLGKPRKTAQFVGPEESAGPSARVHPILTKYRQEMRGFIDRAGLPFDLPPANEARLTSRGASGPLKPTLVEAFKPRGYDCRGESGVFTLRRRTTTNHVVDVELDVGTWSRSVTFMFSVRGPGFNATLTLPVTARDASPQYPIGDTENWRQIVANVAALVDELDRTLVGEIEAAVDPAPAWFDPGR